ncbi:Dps family protein [Rickettsiales endosymbiont of Stachyamoeba lipophora]|uniref:Dps family protein n=1 Tax=Rickettsiales endosymbiont of Stachyamoeba lipophora TaxID=2486578 RepID=UPI000F653C2A|nr:DNA starvation/stationary phase protection protein [Rickettsiales endosymbiont of Stachyamoeba lipophora]AZL16270.1 DNA starvation/stationary phase protection protein [Rickettsiales endosymbiont of Stachyamoeba lipophora]
MKKFIGLDADSISTSISVLSKILASTYIIYLKTQNFHWNVKGPNFIMLHELFGLQYKELADAIDNIAERISMLGHITPATTIEFNKLSTIKECELPFTANAMLQALSSDHELMIIELRNSITLLDNNMDEGTKDLLIERLQAHEKTCWMLASHLA